MASAVCPPRSLSVPGNRWQSPNCGPGPTVDTERLLQELDRAALSLCHGPWAPEPWGMCEAQECGRLLAPAVPGEAGANIIEVSKEARAVLGPAAPFLQHGEDHPELPAEESAC